MPRLSFPCVAKWFVARLHAAAETRKPRQGGTGLAMAIYFHPGACEYVIRMKSLILRKIETPELKLFTLHDGADPLLKQTIRISDIRIYQNVSLVRPSERCHISLVRIPRTQKTAFENEGNVM